MRLTEHVCCIGGGTLGYGISDAYDCNIYALRCGSEYVLIDSGAGMDSDCVIANMQQDCIQPEQVSALILTHAHADHSGGAQELRRRLQLRVLAGELTAAIVSTGDERRMGLVGAREAGVYPASYQFPPCPVDEQLKIDSIVRIGGVELHILPAPGHSADMLVVYRPDIGALFAGDAIFSGGKLAVLNTPDYDEAQYKETIRRLNALPIEQLFSGHGTAVLEDAQAPLRVAQDRFDQGMKPWSIV
ncbi:MBL fold metallo-hydrolase [Paenibacillus sp. J5C_2022]|uniref:MBL fold metallo-hydrolase n=1 Tax=Paenibacillus sp. J5C2022 TaxID=2977129 RepID=UPI0021CFFB51|nr:MBL fold metallo-hydrolase [Paenibacillus sp. J5C2022]MCU6712628.1 MBL fold metallo-hydrolase [Paenibacillus sp. J5C2022]